MIASYYWKSIYTLALIFLLVGIGASVFSEPREGQSVSKITINIPARKLQVYSGQHQLIREYSVGVGRPTFPTPKGQYHIIRKVENPAWENPYKPVGVSRIRPGKGNPLGTRWLGFKRDAKGEYGIHGTNRPESVGHFSSHGCIRMKIKDSEELFSMVAIGTLVEVSYNPAWLEQNNDQILLTVFPSPFSLTETHSLDALKKEIQRRFPTAQIDERKLTLFWNQSVNEPIAIGFIPKFSPLKSLQPATQSDSTSGDDLLDTLRESQFVDVMR